MKTLPWYACRSNRVNIGAVSLEFSKNQSIRPELVILRFVKNCSYSQETHSKCLKCTKVTIRNPIGDLFLNVWYFVRVVNEIWLVNVYFSNSYILTHSRCDHILRMISFNSIHPSILYPSCLSLHPDTGVWTVDPRLSWEPGGAWLLHWQYPPPFLRQFSTRLRKKKH